MKFILILLLITTFTYAAEQDFEDAKKLYLSKASSQEKIEAFTKIIKTDPNSKTAALSNLFLVSIYLQENDNNNAFKILQKIIKNGNIEDLPKDSLFRTIKSYLNCISYLPNDAVDTQKLNETIDFFCKELPEYKIEFKLTMFIRQFYNLNIKNIENIKNIASKLNRDLTKFILDEQLTMEQNFRIRYLIAQIPLKILDIEIQQKKKEGIILKGNVPNNHFRMSNMNNMELFNITEILLDKKTIDLEINRIKRQQYEAFNRIKKSISKTGELNELAINSIYFLEKTMNIQYAQKYFKLLTQLINKITSPEDARKLSGLIEILAKNISNKQQ